MEADSFLVSQKKQKLLIFFSFFFFKKIGAPASLLTETLSVLSCPKFSLKQFFNPETWLCFSTSQPTWGHLYDGNHILTLHVEFVLPSVIVFVLPFVRGSKLAGLTLFVTGGSRGIGKAIALKAAKDGANVVIAAKTAVPHPKLPGTIYTAAEEGERPWRLDNE